MKNKVLIIVSALLAVCMFCSCSGKTSYDDGDRIDISKQEDVSSFVRSQDDNSQKDNAQTSSVSKFIKPKLNKSDTKENTSSEEISSREDISSANAVSSQTNDNKTIDYTKYDGYSYFLENGQLKYFLDTNDGFKLHCFFQYGSPEYVEDVYTIDLDTAEVFDNNLTVKKLTDGKGYDISFQFDGMMFTFSDEKVVMDIVRDESTLAGGAGGSIQTGAYFLYPKS